MHTKFFLVSVMLSSFGLCHSVASDMETYIEKLRKHPEVQQFFEYNVQLDELSEADLALPDPQFYFGIDNMFFDDPEYSRLLSPTKSLGFIQKFPAKSLRIAESSKKKILSKHRELCGNYMHKRLEARLISHLATLKKIKILEDLAKKQLAYYELMEAELKGQIESGIPVYALFFEIDVDRTEIEQHLNHLEFELVSTHEELKWLVGEVPQIQLLTNQDLNWNQKISSLYPIKIAAESLNAASGDLAIVEATSDPNFSVQATYKRREFEQKSSDYDSFNILASISLPIWYKSSQAPRLRAARADNRKAKLVYERICQDWIKKMSVLQAEYENVTEDIRFLQKKKSSRKQFIEAINRGYEAGVASLASVLIAQIDELSLQSQIESKRSIQIRLSAEFNSHHVGDLADAFN